MLFEGLASGLALFVAQFAVAILIESCEEGRSRGFTIARGTTRPMRWTTAMVRRSAPIRATSARAVAARPAPKVGMKCLVRCLMFLVTQLSIAVLVDSPEHRLTEFFTARTMARSRMMRTTWTGPRTTMSIAFARTVVLATGHGFVPTVSAMVRTVTRGATAVIVPMSEPAVAMFTRRTSARTVVRMMPVAIAVVPSGVLAIAAVTFASVGRLFELLPHIGPFCIAELAVAISIETSEHDVAEWVAAAMVAVPAVVWPATLWPRVLVMFRAMLALLILLFADLLLVVFSHVVLVIPLANGRFVVGLLLVPVSIGPNGPGDQGY